MNNDITKLYKKAPCGNCPFRKDCMKGWLGAQGAKRIIDSQSFICHKTTKPDAKQCSGHMQLASRHNAFVRMATALGVTLRLLNRELLFATAQDMINHHTEPDTKDMQ